MVTSSMTSRRLSGFKVVHAKQSYFSVYFYSNIPYPFCSSKKIMFNFNIVHAKKVK